MHALISAELLQLKSITFRKHCIALNQIPVLSIKTCWYEAFCALLESTWAPPPGAQMNMSDSFSVSISPVHWLTEERAEWRLWSIHVYVHELDNEYGPQTLWLTFDVGLLKVYQTSQIPLHMIKPVCVHQPLSMRCLLRCIQCVWTVLIHRHSFIPSSVWSGRMEETTLYLCKWTQKDDLSDCSYFSVDAL